MNSRVRFFRLFAIVNIFLQSILAILVFYFLMVRHTSWDFDFMTALFFTQFIVYIIGSVIILFLINKHPAQNISNAFEGIIYLQAILIFIFNLISLLFIYLFIEIALSLDEERKRYLKPTFFLLSFFSLAASICAAYTAINSFRLLKTIKKNWSSLTNELKNIGTDRS